MPLTLSMSGQSEKEATEQLLAKYLRGAVHEMHRVDAVARHFGKEPNRNVEEHAAKEYMKRHPLRVPDKKTALALVGDVEKHYAAEAKKAPLHTKLHYAMGRVGKAQVKAAVVCGIAAAVGCVAVAHGADVKTVPAAVAVAGGAYMAADYLRMSFEPKKYGDDVLRKKEILADYTRAKQALFVLKRMKQSLKHQKDAPEPAKATPDLSFLLSKKGTAR